MSHEKIIKLIHRLTEKTRMGIMKWEEAVQNNAFTVSFPSYSVDIHFEERELSNARDYYITILNEEGNIVERLSDNDLSDDWPGAEELLTELHEMARRKAMGVDEALDKILSNLE